MTFCDSRWLTWGCSSTLARTFVTCGTFWTSSWSVELWWPLPARKSSFLLFLQCCTYFLLQLHGLWIWCISRMDTTTTTCWNNCCLLLQFAPSLECGYMLLLLCFSLTNKSNLFIQLFLGNSETFVLPGVSSLTWLCQTHLSLLHKVSTAPPC